VERGGIPTMKKPGKLDVPDPFNVMNSFEAGWAYNQFKSQFPHYPSTNPGMFISN
jgi:hypothetical protein